MVDIVEPYSTNRYDFSFLAEAEDLWRYWGFEPWVSDNLSGIRRRVTISKDSLLGEVARYYAYDHIVWRHNGDVDCRAICSKQRPQPDVMLYRFLFVVETVTTPARKRALWLGFRGYVEVYQHAQGCAYHGKIRDLAPLIDKAWDICTE